MKFPEWSLFVFPILVIGLISMFPILAILVAVSVAIWAAIAAQKAAAAKPQDKLALGKNQVQAIAAPDGLQERGRRSLVTPTQHSPPNPFARNPQPWLYRGIGNPGIGSVGR